MLQICRPDPVSPPLPFVNFFLCVSTYQKQSRHTHIHGVCFLSSYIVTLLSNPFNPILCGNKYTFILFYLNLPITGSATLITFYFSLIRTKQIKRRLYCGCIEDVQVFEEKKYIVPTVCCSFCHLITCQVSCRYAFIQSGLNSSIRNFGMQDRFQQLNLLRRLFRKIPNFSFVPSSLVSNLYLFNSVFRIRRPRKFLILPDL